jgi:hypothetical protein
MNVPIHCLSATQMIPSTMKHLLHLIVACLIAVPATAAEAPKPAPPAAVFKAGFAERDITPDIGMEAPGGYGKDHHRTFHDPCKVRAVVFDDGRKRVALVGVDILFVTRHLVQEARAEIQKRCGIAPDSVLIGASHSHSSGPIGMSEPDRKSVV